MKPEKRALIICAHDDDEVIGAGGTIRKLADAGVTVSTLVMAVGNEGYARIEDRDRIAEQRVGEREAAERILGTADCTACAWHDFDNLDCEAVYHEIMRAVRRTRPHVVFTHLATDYLAHRTLATVAPEAVWQAAWQCSMDLGEPWEIGALYQFSVLELIPKPSHVVDITDTFQAKLDAMHAFKSQHEVIAGILDQIEAKARAYGSLVGVRYGEAFVRSQFIPVAVSDPALLLDPYCC